MRNLLKVMALLLIAILAVACGKSEQAGTSFSTTVVLEPNLRDQTGVDLDSVLQTAKEVIERRADAFEFDAWSVERDGSRLVVHLPDVGRDEAVKLAMTGLLELRELRRDEYGNIAVVRNGETTFVPLPARGVIFPTAAPTPNSEYARVLEDAVWIPATGTASDGVEKPLTGRYLVKASLVADPATGMPAVDFSFNEEGARLMEQITTRLIRQPLAFFLDGEPLRGADGIILASIVQAIVSDHGWIIGLELEDAKYVAKILQSGALPVPFEVVSYESSGHP